MSHPEPSLPGSQLTIEQLSQRVGQELGVSAWFNIDQARIDAFADVTGDHQWIHVDRERAAASPMGTTIAHGYLLLSLIPYLVADLGLVPRGAGAVLNYGTEKVRFTSPVPVDSRVRARVRLASVTPRGQGHLMQLEVTMELEGSERPAMVANTLTLALP